MCEMLKHWLETAVDPPPTWETVVSALRSPIVDMKYIAAQLELKYCEPVQQGSSAVFHIVGHFFFKVVD